MIKSIELINFRLFDEVSFSFNSNNIYFYGDNGTGKSSILEAISIASKLHSNRTSDLEVVIKHNSNYARIVIYCENKLEIIISKDSKRLFIDNKEIKKFSLFVGHLKTVLFCKEDSLIINGTPKERRDFLNIEISQIDREYLETLSIYKKLLVQRNYLLKNLNLESDYFSLKVIGKELLKYAQIIVDKRISFLKDIETLLEKEYLIEGKKIKLVYIPSCDINTLNMYLVDDPSKDVQSGFTNFGPHRDDFKFTLNENDIRYVFSSGEQKMLLFALKISLFKLIIDDNKILLADDIMSDLDEKRRNIVLKSLKENNIIMNGQFDIEDSNYEKIKL
ncbi:MAG: DNA replication and repair protein RecF [Acholeplasmatales bacterium]|jgi:DNA replication and repair protein RecF|nr:DNA replication and repair protein RecF [Acholeplasmatales bacterium]